MIADSFISSLLLSSYYALNRHEKTKIGSAKESGKIYKGLFLVSADQQDLKYKDFESILDILRNSPEDEPVDLVFVDLRNVYRGR
jgi:hypothetical protein